jgi:hypothetical protein
MSELVTVHLCFPGVAEAYGSNLEANATAKEIALDPFPGLDPFSGLELSLQSEPCETVVSERTRLHLLVPRSIPKRRCLRYSEDSALRQKRNKNNSITGSLRTRERSQLGAGADTSRNHSARLNSLIASRIPSRCGLISNAFS